MIVFIFIAFLADSAVAGAHPDFGDTYLFDESGDGNAQNDGSIWLSHWVALQSNERCGEDELKVVNIAEGATARLSKIWPGLQILLDRSGWQPLFTQDTVDVKVLFSEISSVGQSMFDGVNAELGLNESTHAPLLWLVHVMDAASGDLSLPGKRAA